MEHESSVIKKEHPGFGMLFLYKVIFIDEIRKTGQPFSEQPEPYQGRAHL